MLALLCCILMCTGVVYATGDDTDGTELQVAQPVILEVQLGPQWAGVEFQLKTDAGLYPGTIAVGQDGILRTELGNSGSYVLSCLTLNAAVPSPGDIPSPDVTQQEQEPLTTDYFLLKLLTDLPPLVLFNSSKVILTLYQSSLERDKQKNL